MRVVVRSARDREVWECSEDTPPANSRAPPRAAPRQSRLPTVHRLRLSQSLRSSPAKRRRCGFFSEIFPRKSRRRGEGGGALQSSKHGLGGRREDHRRGWRKPRGVRPEGQGPGSNLLPREPRAARDGGVRLGTIHAMRSRRQRVSTERQSYKRAPRIWFCGVQERPGCRLRKCFVVWFQTHERPTTSRPAVTSEKSWESRAPVPSFESVLRGRAGF